MPTWIIILYPRWWTRRWSSAVHLDDGLSPATAHPSSWCHWRARGKCHHAVWGKTRHTEVTFTCVRSGTGSGTRCGRRREEAKGGWRYKNFLNEAKFRCTPDVVTSYLLIVLETEPPALRAARERRLEGFWLGLESVLETGSPESRLNDVVQLSYTVPNLCSSSDFSDSEVSSSVLY